MACRVLYLPKTNLVDKVFAENGEESKVFNEITTHLKGDKQSAYKEYLKTRTTKFKEWFGNSKFVDTNGEPLVFYHGADDLHEYFLSNTTRGKATEKLVKNDIDIKYDKLVDKLIAEIDKVRGQFNVTVREIGIEVQPLNKKLAELEKARERELRTVTSNAASADGVFFTRDPKVSIAYGKKVTIAFLRGENPSEVNLELQPEWDPDTEYNEIEDSKEDGRDSIVFTNISDKAPNDYQNQVRDMPKESHKQRAYDGLLRFDDKGEFRHDQYIVFDSAQIKSGVKNTWKYGKDTSNIYNQLESLENKDVREKEQSVEDATKNLLDQLGVKVKAVDEIRDSNGNLLNAIAKADLVKKVIEVVNGKANMATLPEEASHFFINLLKAVKSPLYKSMYNIAPSYREYDDTMKEYAGQPLYQNEDGTPNLEKLTEEAMGQILAEYFIGQTTEEEGIPNLRLGFSRVGRWWERALKAIKIILNVFTNPFASAAWEMFNADIKQYYGEVDYSNVEEGEFLQVDSDAKSKQDTIVDNILADMGNLQIEEVEVEGLKKLNPALVPEGDTTIERYVYTNPVTAEVITFTNRVTDASRLKYIKSRGAAEAHKMSEKNSYLAEGGTKLHSSAQKLAEFHGDKLDGIEIVATHPNGIEKTISEATKNLEIFPTVKGGASSPEAKLSKGVQKVMKQIKDQQKSIDPKGTVKVLTESILMDKTTDTAGTIDLLAIFSDGTAAVFDWKFNTPNAYYTKGYGVNKKLVSDPLDIKLDSYNSQISTYKTMLVSYGVDTVSLSRIIPAQVHYYAKPTKVGETTTYENTNIIQVLNIGGDQNEFMEQIAVAGERTSLSDLNDLVTSLIRSRDINKVRLSNAKGEKKIALRESIRNIDKQIQAIVVKRDVETVIDNVKSSVETIGKRLHINDAKDDKYLTDDDLIEFLDNFSVYIHLGENLQGLLAELKGTDAKKHKLLMTKISAIQYVITNATSAVRSKMHERLLTTTDAIESPVGEITSRNKKTGAVTIKSEAPKELGNVQRYMTPMSESDNPVIRSVHKIITGAQQKTEVLQQSFDEKLGALKDKTKAWAKKSGISEKAAIDKIINSKTGNLIVQVNSEFYEEVKTRQTRGEADDIKWLKDHLSIKKDARKRYIQYVKNATENAQRFRPDIVEVDDKGVEKIIKSRAKDRTTYINNWKSKYDVWNVESDAAWKATEWRTMLELKETTKEEFKAEEWKELEKSENKELLEVVNSYRELVEYLGEMHGEYIPANFVANIRDGVGERATTDGVFSALSGVGEDIRRSMSIVEDDQSMGVVSMDGSLQAHIPVNHLMPLRDSKGMVDPSMKSRDIFKSLSALGSSILNHRHMSEIEATVLIAQDYLANEMKEVSTNAWGGIISKDGEKSTKKTSADTIAYLDSMVKFYLYGQGLQSKDKIVAGISVNKTVRSMMSVLSLKALALPFVPAVAARIAGEALLRINAGLHFTLKGVHKAEKAFVGDNGKFTAVGEFFNIYQQGTAWKRHRDLAIKGSTKYANLSTLYAPLRHSDENIENTLVWAMMYEHGIDEQGNLRRIGELPEGSKTLHDAMTFDKAKGSMFVEGLTETAYLDFRARVKAISRRVKGQMDDSDVLGYNVFLGGKVVGQFKGWAPGLVLSHISPKKYDNVLKLITEGRFSGTTQEIVNAWQVEVGIAENMMGMLKMGKDAALQLMLLKSYQGDPEKRAKLMREDKWSDAAEKKYNTKREALALEMEIWKRNSTDPKILALTDIDEFMRMRTRSVNSTFSELRWVIGSYMAMVLLGGLGPEDDKWVNRYRSSRVLMKILAKARLEMGFMLNPMDMLQMFKSPIPVLQVLTDAQKGVSNFFDEGYKIITGKKDNRDKTPLLYYTLPYLLPGYAKAKQIVEPHAQDKKNPYWK